MAARDGGAVGSLLSTVRSSQMGGGLSLLEVLFACVCVCVCDTIKHL